jgi:hypothetical protein
VVAIRGEGTVGDMALDEKGADRSRRLTRAFSSLGRLSAPDFGPSANVRSRLSQAKMQLLKATPVQSSARDR